MQKVTNNTQAPIEIITTLDPEIISGGNLYNKHLVGALKDLGYDVIIKLIPNPEDYINNYSSSKILIVDSIAIGKSINWNELENLYFLIHMWPSDETNSPDQKLLESKLSDRFPMIHAGHQSAKVYPNKNHLVLPPGIKSNWNQKSHYPLIPFNLVSIANINGAKGYMKTIQALSQLSHLEWQWHIYGNIVDSEVYKQLQNEIDRNGLSKRIHYKGAAEPQQINQIMMDSDLLLHCSDHENNSMVIREAIATNLPFISTPTGDNEYLQAHECGIFTANHTSESIRARIEVALSDPALYNTQVQALRQMEIPSWPEVAKALLTFIHP